MIGGGGNTCSSWNQGKGRGLNAVQRGRGCSLFAVHSAQFSSATRTTAKVIAMIIFYENRPREQARVESEVGRLSQSW